MRYQVLGCIVATSVSGSSLVFDSVGRRHIGSYLCIASNGVPPSISKRVDLRVQCKDIHPIIDLS